MLAFWGLPCSMAERISAKSASCDLSSWLVDGRLASQGVADDARPIALAIVDDAGTAYGTTSTLDLDVDFAFSDEPGDTINSASEDAETRERVVLSSEPEGIERLCEAKRTENLRSQSRRAIFGSGFGVIPARRM